jgi:hypothetical protein
LLGRCDFERISTNTVAITEASLRAEGDWERSDRLIAMHLTPFLHLPPTNIIFATMSRYGDNCVQNITFIKQSYFSASGFEVYINIRTPNSLFASVDMDLALTGRNWPVNVPPFFVL